MTTVQKFKALLKARKDSDCESILEKCSDDEIRKIGHVLNLQATPYTMTNIFIIVSALSTRRINADFKCEWARTHKNEQIAF